MQAVLLLHCVCEYNLLFYSSFCVSSSTTHLVESKRETANCQWPYLWHSYYWRRVLEIGILFTKITKIWFYIMNVASPLHSSIKSFSSSIWNVNICLRIKIHENPNQSESNFSCCKVYACQIIKHLWKS